MSNNNTTNTTNTTNNSTKTARRIRGLVATAVVGVSLLAASPASASGDYDVWRANYGTSIPAATTGDSSGTGRVDAADYVVWR